MAPLTSRFIHILPGHALSRMPRFAPALPLLVFMLPSPVGRSVKNHIVINIYIPGTCDYSNRTCFPWTCRPHLKVRLVDYKHNTCRVGSHDKCISYIPFFPPPLPLAQKPHLTWKFPHYLSRAIHAAAPILSPPPPNAPSFPTTCTIA